MKHKNIFRAVLIYVAGLVIASPVFSKEFKLPDTGQELCYNWDSIIECPSAGEDFYGQDGTYSINPPALIDNGDGTIKDKVTGLTWEKKTEGIETVTHAEALLYCENLVLGGSDDWRLPTRPEYSAVLNYGVISPALDHDIFPGEPGSGDTASYWTTSDYYDNTSQVWKIKIAFGLIDKFSKTASMGKVRCVKGNVLPTAKFVDNGDGTVTDKSTGLMWEQKTDDGGPGDKDIKRTWNDSMKYCESLTLGGYTDWRLPNTKEQERIVDLGKSHPAVDTQFFPNTQNAIYWSGTSCSGCHKFKALSVDYTDGKLYFGVKFRNGEYPENYERCVRSTTGICPAKQVLGVNNPQLENLRDFRDSKLANSALGRKVIQIYYNNADSINAALDRSPTLRGVARRVLEMIAPIVGKN
jgi:hypothetical protein